MAAAVAANGGGTVSTVDRYHFADPTPEEVLERAGLGEHVQLVRVEHSSYCWWLKELIEDRTDGDGNCEPLFDFCYLDGAHDWHIDGLAVVLVERLLKPGGWLLMDDLNWTWAETRTQEPPNLSERERSSPPVRAVWDIVVTPHPRFDRFRLENEAWGWARKGTDTTRRYVVERTTRRSSITSKRVRMAVRRLRH